MHKHTNTHLCMYTQVTHTHIVSYAESNTYSTCRDSTHMPLLKGMYAHTD